MFSRLLGRKIIVCTKGRVGSHTPNRVNVLSPVRKRQANTMGPREGMDRTQRT